METTTQVKVKSECFIKPNHDHQQFNDHNNNKVHYLGPIDLALLSLEPMHKGFLFTSNNQDQDQKIQRLLSKLKKSLSLSVDQSCFYPLAGQLSTQKYEEEHACWIYVDCNKGHGTKFIHATVDLTVSDILSSLDVHPTVRSFFDLGDVTVNHDGHFRPLHTVQVTELVDGIFIGFTMNHSLGDGASLSHFISTFCEIFHHLDDENTNVSLTTISIPHKPICKPIFPDGFGPILKLPYLDPDEFISRYKPGPFRERIFHISSSSMTRLKAQANEQCGLDTISSFQALSSLLWRSVTRARNLQPDHDTTCAFVANTRQRFDPPLSEHQFGNFIVRTKGVFKVGELLSNDLGWAAKVVHNLVKAQDGKAVDEFIKRFAEAPFVTHLGSGSEFYWPNPVMMAGSAQFYRNGPDFGLGKAVALHSGFPNKEDGKVIVNPGRIGDKSVDLEICLRPHTMNALEIDDEFASFVSF